MESQRAKTSKVKSLDDIISFSPINLPNFIGARRFHHSQKSSLFDPYASDSSDSPSPLVKYLRSTTPAIRDMVPSTLFNSSINVEEDVLVMDGIPVPKSNDGGRARTRSTLTSLNFDSASSLRSRSWGSVNANSNKSEQCRRWEESGTCRFGSKCQFAHGKEEIRPPRFSSKNKLEVFKLNTNSGESSSSSFGRKFSVNQNPTTNNTTATASATFSLPTPTPMVPSTSILAIKPNSGPSINDSMPKTDALLSSNWSPLDDGIEASVPAGSTDSSKDVDAYIEKVLYGTGKTKRLPVFIEICMTD